MHDGFTVATREALTHRLDDLVPRRDLFQRTGHRLAKLGQPVRTIAAAALGGRNNYALSWHVIGERTTARAFALAAFDRSCFGCRLCCDLVFSRTGLELFIGKFELVDQPLGAFRTRPVRGTAHLFNLEFKQRIACNKIRVDGLDARFFGQRMLEACGRFERSLHS